MLDLSPEKLMVLFAVGLVVLGPDKLPAAARGMARGLSGARRLASSLTQPMTSLADPVVATFTEPLATGLVGPLKASLTEPLQTMDDAVATLRATIAGHPIPGEVDPPSTTRVPAVD